MTTRTAAVRVGYSAPLANKEFRGLTIAQVISECGEQVARIALAVLVFEDSNSAFFAALTYAVGYLPLVVGGALLGSLADWLPRKQVMLVCHASRAVLVALIALPGVPIGVAFSLLAVLSLLEAPFAAARTALIPDLLPDGPTYVAAVSLSRALNQVDQAAGFFLGGIVLSVLHPRGALLLDAFGFVLAFFVVLVTVRSRPPAGVRNPGGLVSDFRSAADVVFRNPARRALVLIVWLGGLTLILPEGIAVTYADDHGGGGIATGILTAALPAGLFIGAIVLTTRVSARRQTDLMVGLAAGACVLLMVTAVQPPLWATALLWLGSGMCQAYVIPAIATFNLAVDPGNRGRAIGLAAAGLSLSQGLSLAAGGALAGAVGPHVAVACFAAGGLVLIAALRIWWPADALAALADTSFGVARPSPVEVAVMGAKGIEAAGLDGGASAMASGDREVRQRRRPRTG